MQLVEDAQHVKFERRPGVLMANDQPRPRRLDARADVGPAVHVHEAIRAVAGDTEEATRSMVFEAARKDADAGRIEGRPNALAGLRGNRATCKSKVKAAWRGCRVARIHGVSPSSQAVRSTVFVRT